MTIARLIATTCLLVLCFLFCGCRPHPWRDGEYKCEVENVESVQIVCIGETDDDYRFTCAVLCDVADKDSFLDQLNALDYRGGSTPPKPLKVGYVVIRINYFNGDYDYIYQNSQKFYRGDEERTGQFLFDKEQFDDLISNTWDMGQGDGSVVP